MPRDLAAYKLPRAVQIVDQVPNTPSGKIMRRLLEDYDDGPADRCGSVRYSTASPTTSNSA